MTPNPECTCKPGWMKPGWVNCRCPVHGDCNCEREPIPGELNEFECPVHYSRLPYRPSTPPPCPNCIRLEADLEREQEAGLLRKAERDRLAAAIMAFRDANHRVFTLCGEGLVMAKLDILTIRLAMEKLAEEIAE